MRFKLALVKYEARPDPGFLIAAIVLIALSAAALIVVKVVKRQNRSKMAPAPVAV